MRNEFSNFWENFVSFEEIAKEFEAFSIAEEALQITGTVTHANTITMKSNQFHASLRYVKGCRINPLAITFTADSKV